MNLLPDTLRPPEIELLNISVPRDKLSSDDIAAPSSPVYQIRAVQDYFKSLISNLDVQNVRGVSSGLLRYQADEASLDLSWLPNASAAWAEDVFSHGADAGVTTVKSTLKCINETSDDPMRVLSFRSSMSNANGSQHQVLWPKTITIIKVIGEMVWDALVTQLTMVTSETPANCPLSGPDEYVDALLGTVQWLLDEQTTLPRDVRFRYYLSRFQRQALGTFQLKADGFVPHSSIASECLHHPSHIHPGCACEMLSSNVQLFSGLPEVPPSPKYVLVTLEDDKLLLQAVANLENVRYLAFSHVRSHGLGNSISNSLPLCRLQELQKLANEALGETDDNGNIPFWIDTLCVPAGGSAEARAITSAQTVFGLASVVFVLDDSLRASQSASPQEMLTRIRYSAWAKRLWTLQEGTVSRRLHFLFGDETWSLSGLIYAYENGNEYPILRLQSFKDQRYDRVQEAGEQAFLNALSEFWTDLKNENPHGSGPRRFELKGILRLGYLATPKMRLFAEAFESCRLRIVVDSILSVYGYQHPNRKNGVDEAKKDSITASVRLDSLIYRFRHLESRQAKRDGAR